MVARVSSNRTSDSGSRSATAHGRLRAGKNAPAAVLRAPSARPRRRKSRLSCPFGVPQVIRGAQGITPPRQAKIVVNLTSVPCDRQYDHLTYALRETGALSLDILQVQEGLRENRAEQERI